MSQRTEKAASVVFALAVLACMALLCASVVALATAAWWLR